jgi:hypothetical protein
MAGNFMKAFQCLETVVSLLPKITHFFSFAIISQKLGIALMLMSDFKGALDVFKELRLKEINAPFSIFNEGNTIILEWLIQLHEWESGENYVTQDMDKIRLDPNKLDTILDGDSARSSVQPLEVGYRLMEFLSGLGYENILGNICLTIALKIIRAIRTLTDKEIVAAKVRIASICNAGLKYISTFLKDNDIADLSSGYMPVKIQSLWCKARLYNVLVLVSTDIDEKALYKEKIVQSLEIIDNIISIYFDGINDSYIKYINNFWKTILAGNKDLHESVAKSNTCILQDLEDVERSYESSSSSTISNIIQRFKSNIKGQL